MKTHCLALALLAVGCASEIDDKTAATVAEPPPPAAPAAGSEAPANAPAALEVPEGALKLAGGSSLEWVGAKITKDHPGGFKALDGYAVIEGETLRSARLVIDMKSTFSDVAKLTKHLLDEDFFSGRFQVYELHRNMYGKKTNQHSSETETSIGCGEHR